MICRSVLSASLAFEIYTLLLRYVSEIHIECFIWSSPGHFMRGTELSSGAAAGVGVIIGYESRDDQTN